MKRNQIRIFGILASVAFALIAIGSFLPWIERLRDWRMAFSYLLTVRLLGTFAILLLLGAFAILLNTARFRLASILGVAGAICFVFAEVGPWTLWLGGDQLSENFRIFILLLDDVLWDIGWFCLFLATVRLTEMCRWARICALVGLGGRILFSTTWVVWLSTYTFHEYVLPEQVNSFALDPWVDWLIANVSKWISQTFSFILFVAFLSLAIGKLRPCGERVVFAFEGRARRKEYWMWLLWWAIFVNVILASIVYLILFTKCPAELRDAALWLWWLAAGIVMGLLTMPVCVRRLHDRNLSGWWLLLFHVGMLIPVLNVFAAIAYFVVVGCLDGTVGPNDYGDDPKGRKAVAYEPLAATTHSVETGMCGTPEDRLLKIKGLYEKGLLTEAEYNLKREAIISEV